MKIHRLYEDENGISHFEDVDVEYVETTRRGSSVAAPAGDGHHLSGSSARL